MDTGSFIFFYVNTKRTIIVIIILTINVSQQFEQGRELEQCMKKLNKEREKSDELLHQMIPKEIADRLKRGESPIDTCEVMRMR